MNDVPRAYTRTQGTAFSQQVGAQAARRLKARREAPRSIWFGLGMSGLIGWSVTVPALIGAMFGMWVDKRYPMSFSWVLMLMLFGLLVGYFNAWHWIELESKAMQEDSDQ